MVTKKSSSKKQKSSEISDLRSEMKAGFKEVDAKIEKSFARTMEVIETVAIQVSRLTTKVDHLSSEVSRVCVLVEEQNSRNRIVLEGISGLSQRQRCEKLGVPLIPKGLAGFVPIPVNG